jgi:hypothetical protein
LFLLNSHCSGTEEVVADLEGKARFTVATYVRHGGRGGENAAIISAQLARFLLEKR